MCIECEARESGISSERDLLDIVKEWEENHPAEYFPRLIEAAPETCATCGSVGAERWKRSDGIEVCDFCWLDFGTPPDQVIPHPVRRLRAQAVRRPPRKHSYCFTCSTIHWNKLLSACAKCGGGCTHLTEQQLELMERRPKIYYDSEDENEGLSDLARPPWRREKNKAARKVAEEIAKRCGEKRKEMGR